MSFQPYHPSRLGLVVPEDLQTGALATDRTFAFDGVLEWSADDPTQIARHPVELGLKAVTDARLKGEPQRVQVTFLLTDTPDDPNPFVLAEWREIETYREAGRYVAKGAKSVVSSAAASYDPRGNPDALDRCVRRLEDFKRFAAANEPVTLSVPGGTWRRMGIGTVRHRPQGQGAALAVEVQFEELRIVSLRTVAQIPDADLAAAGYGGGGANGSTFVEVGIFGGD